ncbi:SDR family NAD(P)-dependent oxidoreductase [Paenalcaligenes niemegkensis]|uniref:SDR family NAD(P)-dependent oxidoreductase n=1 Tax=Paenalcaligenes niemegkensis TaxID=2895469 RepID=UPI001EE89B83|nr:SDR family NAD(P)-dependent oxidoreductase [Paenalcaligenes niemegkensis]MCQ9616580.1 SDR family NAD(P)-dependent oxidoreductase [Paenalcaligenes niemegkensis]
MIKKQRVIVITGASRGLGASLAKQSLSADTLLITISRSENAQLAEEASRAGASYHAISADLSSPEGTAAAQEHLLAILPANASAYRLINNAGTVDPVALCSNLNDSKAIAQALQLNVVSVISLTATFLQHIAQIQADKRVLNISSGAGRSPVSGWTVYCASKAALDHYTRTLASEGHDVRCASLAPGVIDTEMQAHIRGQSRDDFPGLSRFIDLHQSQQLMSAEATAANIIHYLESPQFGNQVIDDIRHHS